MTTVAASISGTSLGWSKQFGWHFPTGNETDSMLPFNLYYCFSFRLGSFEDPTLVSYLSVVLLRDLVVALSKGDKLL